MAAASDRLPTGRRQQIEALLSHWNDWCPLPGSRWGDTEPPLDDSERRRESEYEVRERYRRYDARLELTARLRAGQVGEGELTALEAARAEHARAGSFPELEQAMRQLRRQQPYSYFILHRRYVDGVPFKVSPERLAASLFALSELLPAELRAPGLEPSESEQRAQRDDRIRALRGEGWSLRRIAGRVGLSEAGVRKVLARQAPPVAES